MDSDGLQPLVQALRPWRRPNDEAQWTQIIAAVASRSAGFAYAFVQLLLQQSNGDRVSQLAPVPTDLVCRAEGSLWSLQGEGLGRVDLVFETPDRDWLLLVENKLGSDYGDRQLERYLEALHASPAERKGLIAITTSTPILGEDQAEGNPHWLGSLRWWQLFDELARLPHEDPNVSSLWRAGLQLLRTEGDFGPMDADIEVVEAWSRRDEGENLLFFLLRELAKPTVDLLRAKLGPDGAQLMYRGQKNVAVLWPWKNQPNVKFAVPADAGEERLRVQFHANSGEPFFSVEARYEHAKESLTGDPVVGAATELLRQEGFDIGNDGWGHYWAKVRPAHELIRGAETSELLMTHLQEAISALVESGLFRALSGRTPVDLPLDPQTRDFDDDA